MSPVELLHARAGSKPAAESAGTIDSARWTVAHDFVYTNGGAEAVTRWMCSDVLPGSQLMYLSGDADIAGTLSGSPARAVLNRNINRSNYRVAAATIPFLVRMHRQVDTNLLVSSYAFAAGLRAAGAKAVYCHSPLRQAWSGSTTYSTQGPMAERFGARVLGAHFRHFDRKAVGTADLMIATSRAVQSRIQEYYGRNAEIIPPPVDHDTFSHQASVEREDFFVWAGRITEPYKQLGIVLDAFRRLPNERLVVVGDGRDRARLERSAPANVHFIGWRGRSELANLYRRSRALIFPSEDDFGLVPVEAMACGTPVIAYGKGGALDTVEDGYSGILFPHQTADAVWRAVSRLPEIDTAPELLARSTLQTWGRARFRDRMTDALASIQR